MKKKPSEPLQPDRVARRADQKRANKQHEGPKKAPGTGKSRAPTRTLGGGRESGSLELDPNLPLEHAVRQVGLALLLDARAKLSEQPQGQADAIHQFRTTMKRTRALLRLVRGELGDWYSPANTGLRDAARLLSEERDGEVMVKLLRKLKEDSADPSERDALAQWEQALALHQKRAGSAEPLEQRIARALSLLEPAERCFERTRVRSFRTLEKGLYQTLHRAARRLHAAELRDDELLHELRRHLKYHRYQLRLLMPNYRRVLDAERRVAKVISDLLGDDHDLAVLDHTVRALQPEPNRLQVLQGGAPTETRGAPIHCAPAVRAAVCGIPQAT